MPMEQYQITSAQFDPYARFAGYAGPEFNYPNRICYARDCRLLYFVSAVGSVTAGGNEYLLRDHDLLLIPPMTPYCLAGSRGSEAYLVNFDFVRSEDPVKIALPLVFSPNAADPLQVVQITDLPQLNHVLWLNMPGLIGQLEAMHSLYKEKKAYYLNDLSAHLSLIISRICRCLLTRQERGQIERIMNYINQNFDKDLTNESIARKFHYHKNYVNRLFRLHAGCTLHQYLLRQRIEEAAVLLNAGHLSVSQVAAQTGWKDLSQFSRCFKKMTGIPPSQAKNQIYQEDTPCIPKNN